jgi:hypothetical protein
MSHYLVTMNEPPEVSPKARCWSRAPATPQVPPWRFWDRCPPVGHNGPVFASFRGLKLEGVQIITLW